MTEWTPSILSQRLHLPRTGFAGAWDALVALVMRRPQRLFETDIKFQVIATQPVELRIAEAEVEFSRTPDSVVRVWPRKAASIKDIGKKTDR